MFFVVLIISYTADGLHCINYKKLKDVCLTGAEEQINCLSYFILYELIKIPTTDHRVYCNCTC